MAVSEERKKEMRPLERRPKDRSGRNRQYPGILVAVIMFAIVKGGPLKVALPCKSGYNIRGEQENRVSSRRRLVGTFFYVCRQRNRHRKGLCADGRKQLRKDSWGCHHGRRSNREFFFCSFLYRKGTGCDADAGCRREDVFLPAVLLYTPPRSADPFIIPHIVRSKWGE